MEDGRWETGEDGRREIADESGNGVVEGRSVGVVVRDARWTGASAPIFRLPSSIFHVPPFRVGSGRARSRLALAAGGRSYSIRRFGGPPIIQAWGIPREKRREGVLDYWSGEKRFEGHSAPLGHLNTPLFRHSAHNASLSRFLSAVPFGNKWSSGVLE